MMNYLTNRYTYASPGRLEQINIFLKNISTEIVLIEFGPGSGQTLKQIENNYGTATLIGFDISPSKVSDRCQIHQADLNTFKFDQYSKTLSKANVFLMLDVLEHLHDPFNFLLLLNKHTMNSGRYIISCPNFSSIRMLLAWLRGKMPKNEFGYFDKTHLHWLSPSDLNLLFKKLNYSEIKISYIFSKNRLIEIIQKIWPSRLCSQFIIYAVK